MYLTAGGWVAPHVATTGMNMGASAPILPALQLLHTGLTTEAYIEGFKPFFDRLKVLARGLVKEDGTPYSWRPRAVMTDQDLALNGAYCDILNRCRCVGGRQACTCAQARPAALASVHTKLRLILGWVPRPPSLCPRTLEYADIVSEEAARIAARPGGFDVAALLDALRGRRIKTIMVLCRYHWGRAMADAARRSVAFKGLSVEGA